MGCGSCGSGASGKPGGCKGNGGCSTGGCNRLNVFDWLNALPLHDGAKPYPIIEVSFNKGSRKEFFKNNTHYMLEKGDWLAVEGLGGYDIGQVSLTGELVKLQLKKYGVKEAEVNKRVLHPATEEELELSCKQKEREPELLTRSRAIARSLKLDMKLCEVEVQADSKKGTFFYTADQRVDFRELIRVYATDFKMKVEMKQIGARQESGKVGGIGSCGRELCCSTWLTDFKSVNTTAARYQNLSINQTKLSGQCGRLKCCLNYELDTYMDALSIFPDQAERLETEKGIAQLQKKDIFKSLMWYSYSDNNKQYPLSITRVKEIQKLNKAGQKAGELQPVELETRESKAGIKPDMGYVNDVGQITLKNLEKNNKKKKKPGGNKSGGDPQTARGPQQAGGAEQSTRSPQQGNKGPRPQGGGGSEQAARGPHPGGQQQGNKGPRPQGGGQQQGNKGGQPHGNKPQQPRNPNQQQRPPRPEQPDGVVRTDQPAGQQPRPPRPEQQNRPPRQQADGTQPAGDSPGGQPKQERPQSQQPRRDRPNRPQQQRRDRPAGENKEPRKEGGEPPAAE